MKRLGTCMGLMLAVSCTACRQHVAQSVPRGAPEQSPPAPLEIRFNPSSGLGAKDGELSCGLPEGRSQAYDPKTGTCHVHFKARDLTVSGFEVNKVATSFPKPLVLRLTGVPLGYGCLGSPLALIVGEKRYPMIDVGHDSVHAYDRFDRTLFGVQRDEDVVTVEFTEKGQALLKPGAQVAFEIDTGW